MYARSYEKNISSEEGARPLPNGYHGVAFENEPIEEAKELPPECEPTASIPRCEEKAPPSFLQRIPLFKHLFSQEKGGLLDSLFSETEDFLLLGLFLLLLLSKEGDSLCAIAVLILLFSDKI